MDREAITMRVVADNLRYRWHLSPQAIEDRVEAEIAKVRDRIGITSAATCEACRTATSGPEGD